MKSIKMLGDFLFSCWFDAGSPDLSDFIGVRDVVVDEDYHDEMVSKEIDDGKVRDYEYLEGDVGCCEMK